MPRLVHFQRGSVIYFDQSREDLIFIVQRGVVVLSRRDEEPGRHEIEEVHPGEFFGIMGAMAGCERGETATCRTDSDVLCMTEDEFEKIFGNNHELLMKTLRKFSRELRNIHQKVERILLIGKHPAKYDELVTVAESFFKEQKWLTCLEICMRYEAMDIKNASRRRLRDLREKSQEKMIQEGMTDEKEGKKADDAFLAGFPPSVRKRFSIPGFERFSRKFSRGQVIIAEFEPGMTFYFVQSGVVQLTKCINDSDVNLNYLVPGYMFGEMAILDSTPRSATCVARTDVEVLEFKKENFSQIVEKNPAMLLSLIKIFCHRLYEQRRRLRVLANPEPQARIAELFLMYDEMRPSSTKEARRTFSLTTADVSRWTGISLWNTHWQLELMVDSFDMHVTKTSITVNVREMREAIKTAELRYRQKPRSQRNGFKRT